MKRFWFLFLWPVFSDSIGCVESLQYLPERDFGEQRIQEVRQEVEDAGWPYVDWWSDKKDGFLDFASEAWVSAAHGHGDCDEAMVLAEEILRAYETIRAFTENHVVLLWQTPGGWMMISNMVLLPWIAPTPQELMELVFGSDAWFVF